LQNINQYDIPWVTEEGILVIGIIDTETTEFNAICLNGKII
jgi:hypothetical protein